MRRKKLTGLALMLLATLGASPASADSKPFIGQVTATWDNIFLALVAPPATFTGGGPVFPIGNTTQTGSLTLQPPIAPNIYPGSGSVTITATNGDKLYFDYQGILNAATGEGFGLFCFTGGTGRYAHATGGGFFSADIDTTLPSAQPMNVLLLGRIKY